MSPESGFVLMEAVVPRLRASIFFVSCASIRCQLAFSIPECFEKQIRYQFMGNQPVFRNLLPQTLGVTLP